MIGTEAILSLFIEWAEELEMAFFRVLVVAAALAMSVPTVSFAAPIQATDVASYVGQAVTVEAVVSAVFTDPRSGTIFLDMGGRSPAQAFTAVIFSQDARTFPSVGSLGGKTVHVTGQVALYKGKPEIILKTADQLQE